MVAAVHYPGDREWVRLTNTLRRFAPAAGKVVRGSRLDHRRIVRHGMLAARSSRAPGGAAGCARAAQFPPAAVPPVKSAPLLNTWGSGRIGLDGYILVVTLIQRGSELLV